MHKIIYNPTKTLISFELDGEPRQVTADLIPEGGDSSEIDPTMMTFSDGGKCYVAALFNYKTGEDGPLAPDTLYELKAVRPAAKILIEELPPPPEDDEDEDEYGEGEEGDDYPEDEDEEGEEDEDGDEEEEK